MWIKDQAKNYIDGSKNIRAEVEEKNRHVEYKTKNCKQLQTYNMTASNAYISQRTSCRIVIVLIRKPRYPQEYKGCLKKEPEEQMIFYS